jgi:hypothetical protein
MVFEKIIRYSPRRRASPRLAEGFSPTASAVYRIYFSISISPHVQRRARAGGLRLAWPTSSAPIGYQLSPIGYHLSAISYRLSPIAYRLSPIAYLSQTFQRIARITVTRHAVPIRNTICAVRSRVAFRR